MIEKQTLVDITVILFVTVILLLSSVNPLNTQGSQNYQPSTDYETINEHRQVLNETALWQVILTENVEYRFEKGLVQQPSYLSAHSRETNEMFWKIEESFVYTPVGQIEDDVIVMDLLFGYQDEKFILSRFSPRGEKTDFHLIDETWEGNENVFRRGRNFHSIIEDSILSLVFLAQSGEIKQEQLQFIQYDLVQQKQLSHSSIPTNCQILKEVIFEATRVLTYCKNNEGNQVNFIRSIYSRFNLNPLVKNVILSGDDNEDFELAAGQGGYLIAETKFDPSIENYVTYFNDGTTIVDLAWDIPYLYFTMGLWVVGNMRFAGGYFQSYVENNPQPQYFAYLFAYEKGATNNDTFMSVFPFSEFSYVEGFTPAPIFPAQLSTSPTQDIAFIYSLGGWIDPELRFNLKSVIIRYEGHKVDPELQISSITFNRLINITSFLMVTIVLYYYLKHYIGQTNALKHAKSETYPSN